MIFIIDYYYVCKKDFLIVLSFRYINLEAVTLIEYHKLKARGNFPPFSLLMSAFSLGLYNYILKKNKSNIYPTFHYPIYVYGQGVGILFRSVKFSVLISK